VLTGQGDLPDKMYIVLEGTLDAMRDVSVVSSNRWPVGKNSWETVKKRSVEQEIVREMNRGDYFGELAIIKNTKRSAHVIARTRLECCRGIYV
jgi:CRP-like cAMP-binding protein